MLKFSRRMLMLTAVVVFTFYQASAAVIVRNATSTGNFALFGTRTGAVQFNHSVNTPNLTLYVGVSTYTSLSGTTLPLTGGVNSVTFNGMQLTRVVTGDAIPLPAVVASNLRSAVSIFRLDNAPVGNGTINVNLDLAGVEYVVAGAVSVSGVLTTAPNSVLRSSVGVSETPTITLNTTVGSGNLVLDTLAFDFDGLAAAANGANQTRRWRNVDRLDADNLPDPELPYFGSSDVGAGSTKPSVNSVTTTNWLIGGTFNWALGAIEINAAPATAAFLSIGGRVRQPNGAAINRVSVFLTNLQNGEQKFTQTGRNGFFEFENVAPDSFYQIRAASKNYVFTPETQVFNVTAARDDVDFTGSFVKSKKDSAAVNNRDKN